MANSIFVARKPQKTQKKAEGGARPQAVDTSGLDARTKAERLADAAGAAQRAESPTGEVGGPKGLEPTRYGDWERAGRCVDF